MPIMVKNEESAASNKTQAYISEIKEISEAHPYFEHAELAYEITFVVKRDEGKKLVIEKTLPTRQAKDWTKRFYERNNNISYTRYQTLNAVFEIFKAQQDEEVLAFLNGEKEEFDLEYFYKKAFDVVFVDSGDYEFIDWVRTFELNNVEVPGLADLYRSKKPAAEEDNTKQVEQTLVDPDDLPF